MTDFPTSVLLAAASHAFSPSVSVQEMLQNATGVYGPLNFIIPPQYKFLWSKLFTACKDSMFLRVNIEDFLYLFSIFLKFVHYFIHETMSVC